MGESASSLLSVSTSIWPESRRGEQPDGGLFDELVFAVGVV